MPELGASFLLDLDHDEAAAAPQHEIQLVATDPRVGVEKSVPAEAIVAKGAPLAVVHAASMADAS
jgi:hypothetical protein